jgi:hypothetical protein
MLATAEVATIEMQVQVYLTLPYVILKLSSALPSSFFVYRCGVATLVQKCRLTDCKYRVRVWKGTCNG